MGFLPRQVRDKQPQIRPELRGIVLKPQLYGHGKDLCVGISEKIISSSDDLTAIINAVHKRDSLSVVMDVYKDLQDLLQLSSGGNENFHGFELRFAAQSGKLNAYGVSVSIPESLTALMFVANGSVDSAQRI